MNDSKSDVRTGRGNADEALPDVQSKPTDKSGTPPRHPYELGWVVGVNLTPPVEEATRYVEAGVLDFAVEFRTLSATVKDAGVSLHVFDHATRDEWLKFDLFGNYPHYHYVVPNVTNKVVRYDEHANGPPVEWALCCLQKRMPAMLRYAGNDGLAGRVDQMAIDAALPVVRSLVEEALEAAVPA